MRRGRGEREGKGEDGGEECERGGHIRIVGHRFRSKKISTIQLEMIRFILIFLLRSSAFPSLPETFTDIAK